MEVWDLRDLLDSPVQKGPDSPVQHQLLLDILVQSDLLDLLDLLGLLGIPDLQVWVMLEVLDLLEVLGLRDRRAQSLVMQGL